MTPTRLARHGTVYTPDGKLSLRLHRLRLEDRPVEGGCDCYTCQRFTRSYLRHLFISRELLAMRLASIHNLRFIMRLMQRIRDALAGGNLRALRDEFLGRYLDAGQAG